MAKPLVLTPLQDLPLIHPGDNLSDLLWQSLTKASLTLLDGDILVIAQKIVSKAEGRLVNLATVSPSEKAIQLAEKVDKDPRFVELVLQESRSVLRTRPGTLIVEHCLGFVCANAGVDHSNVGGQAGSPEDWFLLLPKNPDQSAAEIRESLEQRSGARIGVAIIDSHGRAWRMGIVGTTIGLSGLPGLVDMRGKLDMFGYALRVTQIAAVDELAAAASLVMGQANERCPAIHIRGFPYELREGSFAELIRPESEDLFR